LCLNNSQKLKTESAHAIKQDSQSNLTTGQIKGKGGRFFMWENLTSHPTTSVVNQSEMLVDSVQGNPDVGIHSKLA